MTSSKIFLGILLLLFARFSYSQAVVSKDKRTIRIINKNTDIIKDVDVKDRKKSIEELKKVIAGLFKSYEQESITHFMAHIHPKFLSVDFSRNRLNYSQLGRSVRDDFIIFEGIKHQVFVKTLQIQADGKKARVELRWSRRALLVTKSGEEWILRNKKSILIFEKKSPWRLSLTQFEPLFGQADTAGNIVIKEGTLNGKKITDPITIGVIKKGGTEDVKTTNKKLVAVDSGLYNIGQKINLNTGAVSYYEDGVTSLTPGVEVAFLAAPGNIASLYSGVGYETIDGSDVGSKFTQVGGKTLTKPITIKNIIFSLDPNELELSID